LISFSEGRGRHGHATKKKDHDHGRDNLEIHTHTHTLDPLSLIRGIEMSIDGKVQGSIHRDVRRRLHSHDLLLVDVVFLSHDESSGLDPPNHVCVLVRMNFPDEIHADPRNQRTSDREPHRHDLHDHIAR
jgi:hypothetical protein